MTSLGWFKNRMKEDMADKLLSSLCTNSLALAGFSFTSLAVFLGFYKDNLQQVSPIIQYLIVSTILFFLSSELAREGHVVIEYLLSEGLYLASSIILLIAFAGFVVRDSLLFGSMATPVLCVAILLFCAKLAYSALVVVKRVIGES